MVASVAAVLEQSWNHWRLLLEASSFCGVAPIVVSDDERILSWLGGLENPSTPLAQMASDAASIIADGLQFLMLMVLDLKGCCSVCS